MLSTVSPFSIAYTEMNFKPLKHLEMLQLKFLYHI